MITNGYTVYDRKTLTYSPPFFAVTDGAALRSFIDLANDPQTSVGRYPTDYVLFRIGAFDDASGFMLPASNLSHVADAQALVRTQQPLPFDPPLPALIPHASKDTP